MKVLVTGISGALGRMVARKLLERGHEVFGLDRRPWPDAPKGVEMLQEDIRKRPAEDLFRTKRPEAVIHMATVTHFTARFEERYRINLGGTRAIFDHCHTYGVKHIVFVGRATVYGAAMDARALPHRGRPAPRCLDLSRARRPRGRRPLPRARRSGAGPRSTRRSCAWSTPSDPPATGRSPTT